MYCARSTIKKKVPSRFWMNKSLYVFLWILLQNTQAIGSTSLSRCGVFPVTRGPVDSCVLVGKQPVTSVGFVLLLFFRVSVTAVCKAALWLCSIAKLFIAKALALNAASAIHPGPRRDSALLKRTSLSVSPGSLLPHSRGSDGAAFFFFFLPW